MKPVVGLILGLGLVVAGSGCQTTDDARVLQTLNQRGFGRPTKDANRRYYVGIGDRIVIRDINHKEYNGLSENVRMDGTITLPDVGEVYVNGLTPEEITEVVRQRYDRFVLDTSGMEANVTSFNSKRYYITSIPSGLPQGRPRSINFNGDTLLVDALISANFDAILVDTADIKVIRGDPENPLIISCDWDAICSEGLTRDNIQIRENDIIYLTPSIMGWIVFGVEWLITPLKPIQQLVNGSNVTISTLDSFGEPRGNYNNRNYNY